MENNNQLFVEFEKYCKTCQYENINENESPCGECLEHPVNENSHKPVCYKKRG